MEEAWDSRVVGWDWGGEGVTTTWCSSDCFDAILCSCAPRCHSSSRSLDARSLYIEERSSCCENVRSSEFTRDLARSGLLAFEMKT